MALTSTTWTAIPDRWRISSPTRIARAKKENRPDLINAYDNTIRYTDLVLSGVIERLESTRRHERHALYERPWREHLPRQSQALPSCFAPELRSTSCMCPSWYGHQELPASGTSRGTGPLRHLPQAGTEQPFRLPPRSISGASIRASAKSTSRWRALPIVPPCSTSTTIMRLSHKQNVDFRLTSPHAKVELDYKNFLFSFSISVFSLLTLHPISQ